MIDTSNLRSEVSRRAALAVLAGVTAATVTIGARGTAVADEGLAADAIKSITRGAVVKPGRVLVVMPELAESGNTVALTVTVESPSSAADHVKAIHIVADKNPIAHIVTVHLGPRAGRAKISTNIRLATTQVVTALAEMSDGQFWSGTQEVIVTLAACLDGG